MKNTKEVHILLICFFLWQFISTFIVFQRVLPAMINAGIIEVPGRAAIFTVYHFTIFVIPMIFAIVFAKKRGLKLIPFKKPDPLLIIFTVLMGIAIRPLGILVSYLTNIAGVDDTAIEGFSQIIETHILPVSMLVMAVMPSLTEEFLFRGAAVSGYRGVAPMKAALVNGLLFGLMHGNIRQFFYAAILGVFITLVVIRAGSILYGIIMHFVINGVQVLLTFFAEDYALEAHAEPGEPIFLLVTLTVFAAASTWIYLWIYKSFKKRCEKLDPEYTIALREEPVHVISLIVAIIVGVSFMTF